MYTLFSHLPTLGLTLLLAADVHGAAFNLPKRDLVVNSALPSGWSYSGCYTDNTDPRTLHSDSYVDSAMTESSCINYCNGKGYPYAGIEYGVECYCQFEESINPTKTNIKKVTTGFSIQAYSRPTLNAAFPALVPARSHVERVTA